MENAADPARRAVIQLIRELYLGKSFITAVGADIDINTIRIMSNHPDRKQLEKLIQEIEVVAHPFIITAIRY